MLLKGILSLNTLLLRKACCDKIVIEKLLFIRIGTVGPILREYIIWKMLTFV